MKRKKGRAMWIIALILVVLFVGILLFLNQPTFGKLPSDERLERITESPNYQNGEFRNPPSTSPHVVSGRPKIANFISFLFRKVENLRPIQSLPAIKTDLTQFAIDQEIIVWFGHSSLYIQAGGKRILVDPVLVTASPLSFVNKPFKGTELYSPESLPDIDYLIITHDHWDHLDYHTVKHLKDKNTKIICGLGVGEYFEYWGFERERIVEMDWNQEVDLGNDFSIHSLPAKHFSGRGLKANKTLWLSYMMQVGSKNIYISGDGGYGTHFRDIGERFGRIDLAIMENGQYNEDWQYIHLMPKQLVQAIKDLNAERVMTVHNSKYALGKHPWQEPLNNISGVSRIESLNLITPMIGEPVDLNDTLQVFGRWWEEVE